MVNTDPLDPLRSTRSSCLPQHIRGLTQSDKTGGIIRPRHDSSSQMSVVRVVGK
jgi:hypothetical protein